MSRPIECTIAMVNPNVNYGCWGTMVCQYGFISSNKYIALVGTVGNRETMHVWGRGYMGNLCLLNLTVNLNLLSKK